MEVSLFRSRVSQGSPAVDSLYDLLLRTLRARKVEIETMYQVPQRPLIAHSGPPAQSAHPLRFSSGSWSEVVY